jgi:hypothetical protein
MIKLVIAALGGAVTCLALLYWAGRRHQRHTGRATGPNSRMPVAETVLRVVRKD